MSIRVTNKPPRDFRSLARLITAIESRDPKVLRELARLSCERPFDFAQGGRATLRLRSGRASDPSTSLRAGESRVIGITGPPGSGKSTLVDGLIARLRGKSPPHPRPLPKGERERKGRKGDSPHSEGGLSPSVGVVAVDPSSPFSGGALLGDRIRMQSHAGDKGVFIRSVGSRGAHGGLSRATRDIVRAMLGYGMDYVIVETVGVGQTELDIMEIADISIVVLTPESGDMVQTMKAGLLEIADIFVVNKADRPGADEMKKWLIGMFDTGAGMDEGAIRHHGIREAGSKKQEAGKEVPIILTQAHRGEGIDELMENIHARLEGLKTDASHKAHQENIRRQEFLDMCAEEFKTRLEGLIRRDKRFKNLVDEVVNGEKTVYEGLKAVKKAIRF